MIIKGDIKMEKVRIWIIDWFEKKSDVPSVDIDENKNYVESGWIDSFQFLDLIREVEEEFEVSFSDDDFSKEELLTIKGIIEIIISKL